MNKWLSREQRKWLYGVCLTVVPLLVFYGIINQDSAPLWIALVAAILSPAVALGNLTPEPEATLHEREVENP